MPKFATNDNPADPNVNEYEFTLRTTATGTNDTCLTYIDYYISKNLDNLSVTYKDSTILNNVSPSSILPEEITINGNWENSGCTIKCFVVRTPLETRSNIAKYLSYVPRHPTLTVDVSVCMYDYYFQVELRTGLGGDPTNNKFVYHFHRGFSRHRIPGATVVFGGDSSNKNILGVYEMKIFYGFSLQCKIPNRFDNIYSTDKYLVENANQAPPKKFLNIYESIRAPISLLFDMNFLTSTAFKALNPNRNNGLFLQPPAGVPEGTLVAVNPVGTSIISFTANQVNFVNSSSSSIVEKSDYTIKFYGKYTAIDGRQPSIVNGVTTFRYQTGTQTSAYSTPGGSTFNAQLRQAIATNILVQNKTNVSVGPTSTFTGTIEPVTCAFASNAASTLTPNPYFLSTLLLKYQLDSTFSNGFVLLSDSENSKSGIRLYQRKLIRVNPEVFFYDSNYTYSSADPIGFLAYGPTSLIQRPGFNADGTRNILANQTSLTVFDFHNMKSCSVLNFRNRLSSVVTNSVNTSINTENNVASYISNTSSPSKFYLELMPKNFQNSFNFFDSPEDSPVFFRGERKLAFTYNRIPNIDLNSLVVINGPNTIPSPTNLAESINTNSYRYISYELRLDQISSTSGNPPTSTTVPHRITIWEQQGSQIIEKYYDRSAILNKTSGVGGVLDLMLPDYPGKLVDTTDHPYPRANETDFSEESQKDVYYGVGRIIKIDVHCGTKATPNSTVSYVLSSSLFNFTASINPTASIFRNDFLRFNPSNGKDTNLVKIESGSTKFGRKFLLLQHEGKPEQETDIIYENNSLILLTISDFVNRLNSLHNGLRCLLAETSPDAYATYIQGYHYNLGAITSSALITSTNYSFLPPLGISGNVYYSDIFMGTLLDFPPYIQDFFNTNIPDSWKSSFRRQAESTTFHLDLRCQVCLRSFVYGTQNFKNAATNSPLLFEVTRKNELFQLIDNVLTKKSESSRSNINSPNFDLGGGFYRISNPYIRPPYDYTSSQFSASLALSGPSPKLPTKSTGNNYVTLDSVTTPSTNTDLVTNFSQYQTNVNIFPNTAIRLSFGLERSYVNNPFANRIAPPPPPPPPSTELFFYTSALYNKLTKEISIILSQSQYSLSPLVDSSTINTTNDGTGVIILYSPNYYKRYSFTTTRVNFSNPNIIGWNLNFLNQNNIGNFSTYVLSESYRSTIPESLLFLNKNINDETLWYYYDDPTYEISKLFKRTFNNAYDISQNFKEIFCLGIYKDNIILHVVNLDNVKTLKGTETGTANNSNYALLIDGPDISTADRTSVWPELLNWTPSSLPGTVTKTGAVVSVEPSVQVVFFINNNEKNRVYYKIINNTYQSAKILLFEKSDFSNTSAFEYISNISATYDKVRKKICMIFMFTDTYLSIIRPQIFYTEFDYNNGSISVPNLFHHVAGFAYDVNSSKPGTVFWADTDNKLEQLPYQKPSLIVFDEIFQKGRSAVLYRNTNGSLFITYLNFFSFTSNKTPISIS